MNLTERAQDALDRLRAGTKPEGRPSAEHALALVLETVFRTGDSRSTLATTELERYVPSASGHNATRIIRRVLDTGALVEITDPAFLRLAGVPSNTRAVTLPGAAIDGRMSGLTDVTLVTIDGRCDTESVAIDVGQTGGPVAIDGQIIGSNKESPKGLSIYNSVEEYVSAMNPRSLTWKANGDLGSGAARIYAVVISSPRPVSAGDVCTVLNGSPASGNRGARNMLNNLSKHGLITRTPDNSGWIAGAVTPATHNPAACGGCNPSLAPDTTPAPIGRERGSQPQDGAVSDPVVSESFTRRAATGLDLSCLL